jgi:hypothetical protein
MAGKLDDQERNWAPAPSFFFLLASAHQEHPRDASSPCRKLHFPSAAAAECRVSFLLPPEAGSLLFVDTNLYG